MACRCFLFCRLVDVGFGLPSVVVCRSRVLFGALYVWLVVRVIDFCFGGGLWDGWYADDGFG